MVEPFALRDRKSRGPGLLVRRILLVLISLWPALSQAGFDPQSHQWESRVSLEGKAASDRSVGRADLFWPFWQQSDRLVFADVRAVDASGTGFEGNVGLGFRRIMRDSDLLGGDWILGLYGFFDRRKTETGNYFSQGTFGVEGHVENWTLRANVYLPDRSSHTLATRMMPPEVSLQGTSLISPGGRLEAREWALPGFDVEMGRRFRLSENQELWLYASYFRFDRSETPTVDGPRGRAEYRLWDVFGFEGSEISIGAEYQDDDVRGRQFFAVARFSIPLGGRRRAPGAARARTWLDRRMTTHVQRDVDVVDFAQDIDKAVGSRFGPEFVGTGPILDPESGESLNLYFIAASGDGDCSQEKPCTVAQAQGDASYGAGDTLVLLDGGGTIASDVTLTGARQQVLGGGDSGSLTLDLPDGNQFTAFQLGARPTLQGTVTLGDDSTLRGFNISGVSGSAVVSPAGAPAGEDTTNVTIADLHISNVSVAGISISRATNVSITDVQISDTGWDGIHINARGEVSVTNSTISRFGSCGSCGSSIGVSVQLAPSVSLSLVTVTGEREPSSLGISLVGVDRFSLSNNTVRNTGTGIHVEGFGGPSVGTIMANLSEDNVDDGIVVTATTYVAENVPPGGFSNFPSSVLVTLDGNVSRRNGRDGYSLTSEGTVDAAPGGGSSLSATFSGNSANDNGRHGYSSIARRAYCCGDEGGRLEVDFSDNDSIGNQGAGFAFTGEGDLPALDSFLSSTLRGNTSTGNAVGVSIEHFGSGGYDLDDGRNRFFGNTIDMSVRRAAVSAMGNWWGDPAGLDPARKQELDGGSIDSSNPLAADPNP